MKREQVAESWAVEIKVLEEKFRKLQVQNEQLTEQKLTLKQHVGELSVQNGKLQSVLQMKEEENLVLA